jgi:hypothetical protein
MFEREDEIVPCMACITKKIYLEPSKPRMHVSFSLQLARVSAKPVRHYSDTEESD